MKKTLAIISVLFIILGFGMIHGGPTSMEILSIAMIGLGAGYLIFLLLSSSQAKKE